MNFVKFLAAATALPLLVMLLASPAQAQFHFGQNAATPIHNPYCWVPTYAVPREPRNGGINIDPRNSGYYITVDQSLLANQNFLYAILAHECGHVRHGHGVQVPSNAIAAAELEADCFAAETLARRGELQVLGALRQFVGSCGHLPSGPWGYPSCNQRLERINACAARATQPGRSVNPRLVISR